MAPQQVEQAVVLARGHHRDALALARVRDAPVHLESLGQRREVGLEPGPIALELGERRTRSA